MFGLTYIYHNFERSSLPFEGLILYTHNMKSSVKSRLFEQNDAIWTNTLYSNKITIIWDCWNIIFSFDNNYFIKKVMKSTCVVAHFLTSFAYKSLVNQVYMTHKYLWVYTRFSYFPF